MSELVQITIRELEDMRGTIKRLDDMLRRAGECERCGAPNPQRVFMLDMQMAQLCQDCQNAWIKLEVVSCAVTEMLVARDLLANAIQRGSPSDIPGLRKVFRRRQRSTQDFIETWLNIKAGENCGGG